MSWHKNDLCCVKFFHCVHSTSTLNEASTMTSKAFFNAPMIIDPMNGAILLNLQLIHYLSIYIFLGFFSWLLNLSNSQHDASLYVNSPLNTSLSKNSTRFIIPEFNENLTEQHCRRVLSVNEIKVIQDKIKEKLNWMNLVILNDGRIKYNSISVFCYSLKLPIQISAWNLTFDNINYQSRLFIYELHRIIY